ncbi:hypothetical protein NL676_031546 [Syzygium grande]|nr:hypothetical protein NL676_031546 [Syzygium grande]
MLLMIAASGMSFPFSSLFTIRCNMMTCWGRHLLLQFRLAPLHQHPELLPDGISRFLRPVKVCARDVEGEVNNSLEEHVEMVGKPQDELRVCDAHEQPCVLRWPIVTSSMTPTLLMSASGLKKLMTLPRGRPWRRGSFLTELSQRSATFFPSLENKNLSPAGPHKNTIHSPSSEVLNTGVLYLFIQSWMNISGLPLCWEWRNLRISPMIGHPKLLGGRFSRVVFDVASKDHLDRGE